ncbi:thiamine biosynthesis lipoprotein [Halanaerobium saccharolyticum]|uniref:FAD:protein FMN transferase n=1 Tax=Halanaerobium saccharolyticum TaxID=43595 RepID=A0A4R7YYV3_9FIRM|nr:FAD:protein FMN transferase [Halanaerobium saccharolyticum]RAK08984.1 thiamine biosynthesis lipoprotein [Halanaerobium saccharolyticum]TDW02622.1 thiamine biosynthesis lipoprotein [Halanaerobium saccharolyticum]TDX60747.1 thiamine biosynthesis lipoprotein [Halanaerobium saccharolyticum]
MFKNKKIILLVILSIFLLILTACGNDAEEMPQAEDNAFLMDTLVQMRAHGENAEIAVEESMERIREIENLMSKTIETSDIYKLNNNPESEIEIDPESMEVLKKAVEYAEMTDGGFDPTIGALVELWGIGTRDAAVPDESDIEEALANTGYQYLELQDNTAEITNPGVKIDLGGIAKGYAAEEVKKIVQKHKIEHAFVNLGGNVLVIGDKVDGSPWKIGIQDPRKGRGNVMAIVEAVDLTIVTSGNYERYFEEDGELYHHILDPKTGYPAENNLLSVSIISENSFDADALSTAVYVMGLERGMEFIEDLDDVNAMFITENLDVYLSSGLNELVNINDSDFNLIEGENLVN